MRPKSGLLETNTSNNKIEEESLKNYFKSRFILDHFVDLRGKNFMFVKKPWIYSVGDYIGPKLWFINQVEKKP